MLSLSFVRILPDGKIQYFNHGENKLLMYTCDKVRDRSAISAGKIGLFKIMPNSLDEKITSLMPYEDILSLVSDISKL